MAKHNLVVLTRRVESKILVMRGRKVILDSDLAELYGVAVKRLNEQVKRNAERFPSDFVFSGKRDGFEVAICDLKRKRKIERQTAKIATRWKTLSALCVHGTWRHHGGDCTELETSCRDEYLCCPGVRAHAGCARDEPENRRKAEETGAASG